MDGKVPPGATTQAEKVNKVVTPVRSLCVQRSPQPILKNHVLLSNTSTADRLKPVKINNKSLPSGRLCRFNWIWITASYTKRTEPPQKGRDCGLRLVPRLVFISIGDFITCAVATVKDWYQILQKSTHSG